MENSTKIIKQFIQGIAGLWYNPETKNKYLFTPSINDPAKGEVNIIQHGSNVEIPLHIDLKIAGNYMLIFVEGSEYKVSLTHLPTKALDITLAPGKIVHLLKHP